MIKNIFGFNQKKVLNLIINTNKIKLSIDFIDLIILRDIYSFIDRGFCIKKKINGDYYYWIQYKAIINDYPIFRIKNQALVDRINKLVVLNLLDKYVLRNKNGTFTLFKNGSNRNFIEINKIENINNKNILYKDQLKDKRWKKLANKIRKRDNYTCQKCGSHEHLQVHHKKYIKNRLAWEYDEENLITLCSECHKKVHHLK